MPITRLLRGPIAAAESGQAIVCAALALEAEIITRQFGKEICGSDIADLSGLVGCAAGEGCRGIVSFGLSGALSPDLRSGDIVVASKIVGQDANVPTDDVWSAWLLSAIPTARYGPTIGLDVAMAESAARCELGIRFGALAVDMESHVIARLAAAHALRFVALRVVIDGLGRNIPETALACISSGGETSRWQLGRLLLERPSDTFDMIRLWADWLPARRALLDCSEALSASVRAVGL